MKKIGGTGLKANVAAIIVACIWINNVAFNIPMFIWGNVHTTSWSDRLKCYAKTADFDGYILATRIINFYVPLFITWTSYIGIIYKFKRTANKAIIYCEILATL